MIVAPSMLAANFNELQKDIDYLKQYDIKILHIDIMDGQFVPNFTFGPVVLEGLKHNFIKDVHLMTFNPVLFANYFKKIDPDFITFHFEAVENVLNTINEIKKLGCKVGISIKPNTDVKVLDLYLDKIDLVLIMTVEPGFGGQTFMNDCLPKIKYLSDLKKTNNYNYLIEVDGGINEENALLCKSQGCEIAVAGTYVFNYLKKKDFEGLRKTLSNISDL